MKKKESLPSTIVMIKTCTATINCPCVKCFELKKKADLRKYQCQSLSKTITLILEILLETNSYMSAKELQVKTGITQPVISKAINWLRENETNFGEEKKPVGVDGRNVLVYYLKNK